MTARTASSDLSAQLPVLAVLGLSDRGDADWPRLRSLQYARLADSVRTQVLTQALAGLTTGWLVMPLVSHALVAGWLLLLAVSVLVSARCDQGFGSAPAQRPDGVGVLRHACATIGNALVWSIAVLVLAEHAPLPVQLEIWTILAMLMTVSAVTVPSVPLAATLFSAIVGLAVIVGFLRGGGYEMAGIAALFVCIVIGGAIEASRNFLATRLAEAGVADRNEVVSLLLREFEDGKADWLWEIDPQRRARSVSRRFAFALGLEPREIEGQSLVQLLAGEDWQTGSFDPSLHELVEKLKHRENFSDLVVRVKVGAAARWWKLSGAPRQDEAGNFDGFRGVGSDITAERESSEKIAWLARYDTLTGLPNRMMLTEELGAALRYADQWRSRCALLMLDLDRFKAVNDTLGHLVGDQLLARVSERLQGLMGENALCGRLGGDEFAIVIRDAAQPGQVDRMACAVIERLSEPYAVEHHTLYIGVSVGSALGPLDGTSVEMLMRNADLALYRAKDEGGGCHIAYEPGLHARAEERRKLEVALRSALERDEFVLHYQPVVDARDERIVCCEALLRWNSPEHGLVAPERFIPIAEDTRLIVAIGEWVLREACTTAARWPTPTRVAVNVSAEQLLDARFLDRVVASLAVSGLAPQRLEIEVTENIFERDAGVARATLERVMALGCGVTLDDFGSGYSSLAYIRNFRFSTVKMERSFVKGAASGNPESLAIIRAVIAMAESLEMTTTAQGVETEQELDTVRALGCCRVQGHYYGRAVSAADLDGLFERQRRTG